MNRTTKTLIFSALLFSLSVPLTSCQKNFQFDLHDPKWKRDERQYVNYEKIYHIKEKGDKDYYDIDFTKDVFPNGLLIDQEGKQYNLKDEYDTVVITSDSSATIPFLKLHSFKTRLTKEEQEQIFFRFLNSKTYTYSEVMHLGRIYDTIDNDKENVVHIKTIDDFDKIKEFNKAIFLDNDIDFSGKVFDDNSDRLFGKYWGGIFLNPDKHVLKNITYETSNPGSHSFIVNYINNAWVDSLIIDDFKYTSKYEKKGNGYNYFSILTKVSRFSYFSNCKITNFSIDANDLYAAPFVNLSIDTDFYNCEVSGNINNRYEPKINENGITELHGRTAGFCNVYQCTDQLSAYCIMSSISAYQNNQTEENLNNLYRGINKLPVYSRFMNNKITVNVTGKGKSGGIFTTADRTNQFFANSYFVGNVKGKYTGEITADSYFCEIDNLYKENW